jgi:diguanylate cyclase (GGDEF)-like protein
MKTLNTRSRITLLVVLAALPALAFTAYSTWDERARAERQSRQELTRLATLAAQRQAQIIEGARQTLVAVALASSAFLTDQARCNDYLRRLLANSAGIYQAMGMLSADNVLLCNAAPWQGRIVARERLYLQLAKATGKFAIGEYQIGLVTKREAVNFGYPITDSDGGVTGVAFVAVNLKDLNRMAATTPLPPQSILTVVDRNGVVLARHPETGAQIGQKLRDPTVLANVFSGRAGVFRAIGTDDADRMFAYDAVAENPDGTIPIRVLVSIPMNVIFGEADRAFVRDLIGIVLATVLLLIAAWYGAEVFMLRKIRALRDAAGRVHAGDLSARTGLRHEGEELSQVGEAFDEMIEALQRRDAELKRALQDLQEQAITDPLTGLLNRRYLQEYLPRELTRATRNGAPVALIMMDLDYFKRVNDTLGHEAGDLVLREIGALLRNNLRASDIACRFGGEEFVIVLPESSLDGARKRAEAIRAATKHLNLMYRGQPLGTLTASCGVALFPDHAADPQSLLRAADEALYSAKGSGRDRVVISEATARTAEVPPPKRQSRQA